MVKIVFDCYWNDDTEKLYKTIMDSIQDSEHCALLQPLIHCNTEEGEVVIILGDIGDKNTTIRCDMNEGGRCYPMEIDDKE